MAQSMGRAQPGASTQAQNLWRDSDFLKLWSALSVSLVGSQVTALALPLLAALTLNATPVQMGMLAAAGEVPFVFLSLPAGVWIDRVRRKPILIGTDLASAALLLSLPVAALIGELGFAQLLLVALGVGALNVFGEVAHYAFAPALIGRERLVDGNSTFQISHSVASSAGPGLAGVLVQLLSAPFAVLLDAASFLCSALLVGLIRKPEPAIMQTAQPEPFAQAIAEGLRALLGHPLLRPIIVWGSLSYFFKAAGAALYILYLSHELQLSPMMIGLIFAVGGVCAIPGAILTPWAGKRFGVGPAIIGGWVLTSLAALLVPSVAGSTIVVVSGLMIVRALDGATGTVANIHQWTLRQTVTADEFQGRVTASHRFIVYGAGALGAVLGGLVGTALGLRPTLFVCGIGAVIASLGALSSPLRELREMPVGEERREP